MRLERGFTLLELLVVMVLIAILSAAAIAGINFVFSQRDARTEAERFAALSRLAAEEALLTGREYGIRIDDDEVRFFVYQDETGQWQPLEEDKAFAPRPIPETLDFDLVLDGQDIVLGGTSPAENDEDESAAAEDGETEAVEPPQIMFLSSGEVTPYTLTIDEEEGEQTWIVESDLLGRTELREAGP